MKTPQSTSRKTSPDMKKAFRFLGLSLPFLFLGPVIITMGFKAIAREQSFFLLIIGIIIALIAVILMVSGIRKILNALFDEKE